MLLLGALTSTCVAVISLHPLVLLLLLCLLPCLAVVPSSFTLLGDDEEEGDDLSLVASQLPACTSVYAAA
jgi:hypothetical protein